MASGERVARVPFDRICENILSRAPLADVNTERRLQELAGEVGRNGWETLSRSLGKRYASCRLDNFRATDPSQRHAHAECCRFAATLAANIESGRGVVMFGPPGTGKDHLLTGLMYIAVKLGKSVMWRNAMDLFGDLRDRIDKQLDEGSWIRRRVLPDVLCLSDPVPPKGGLTEFQAVMLYRLVDARYRECKATWVSLNVAKGEEAGALIGDAVKDRLTHDALVLFCDGESFRQKFPLDKTPGSCTP